MATQSQPDNPNSRAGQLLAGVLCLAAIVACAESGAHDEDVAGTETEVQDAVPKYSAEECEAQTPGKLFSRRIEPLLKEERPKSCNQCHLSGVDFSAFVRDDPCETMACLVEDGLVDLDAPSDSVILTWIQRAEPDSELITDEVIDEEYRGFLEWIGYSASCTDACKDVECGPREEEVLCATAEPVPEEEDIAELSDEKTDCSALGIEKLFRETIYRGRGRCYPCHYDAVEVNIDGDPPGWVKTEGNCEQASLATLRELQRGDYFNTVEPDQSLILLKPLSEDEGGVKHGGSEKFHGPDDPGYQSFMLFLERYAECSGDAGDGG